MKIPQNRQFQKPKVPSHWGVEERRYAQATNDLFDYLFYMLGRLGFDDLGSGMRKRFTDAEGNISTLETTAQGLASSVQNAEGDISALEQTATSLQTQITNNDGDISTLQQTTQGLETSVQNAQGDITALEQSAQGFTASIQSLEDDMEAAESTLALKADQASLTQVQGDLQTQINSVPGQINLAVQNVQVGGRNLLKNSGNSIQSTAYILAACYFGNEIPIAGETYTLTVKFSLAADRTSLRAYSSGGYKMLASFAEIDKDATGVASKTFTMEYANGKTPAEGYNYLSLYQMPNTLSGASTVEWWTLMRGNKAPKVFVPAPEDPVSSLVNSTVEIGQDIRIKTGGKFTTQSQNFSIDAAGNVVMKGRVEASSGKIGGFDIGQTGIYYQKSHVGADVDGVYVGPDGIAVGKQSDAHIRLSPYGYMYGKYLEFENDTQWDNTWFALVVNKSTGRRFRVDLSISDRNTYIDASIALKSLATMVANFLSFRVNADGTNPYMIISPYTRVDGELVKDISGAAYPYLHTQNFAQHVTPAAIGALPTAGGTMTGHIDFDASSAAKAVYFSGDRGVRSNPDGTLIVSASSGSLYLRPRGNYINTGQVVISQNAITRDGYTVFDTNNFGSARAPAGTDYGTFRPRNIAFGTGAASGGGNGDVYLRYV